MKALTRVYGTNAYTEWRRRIAAGGIAWQDLSDTTQSAREVARQAPLEVHSTSQLIAVLSFLNVMNKNLSLLYRGQGADFPLLPSLEREQWSTPYGQTVKIGGDRMRYWRRLVEVQGSVRDLLMRRGVPRWRPFERHPAALWALLQHYQVWPTPLLDFSGSWRVAATFAFNFDRLRSKGFLYVVGVSNVRSDLMAYDEIKPDDSAFAVRLNAVCPPDARRPHLQEGFLVGQYPFAEEHVDDPASSDASAILVAKIALVNDGSNSFWDDADFPILRRGSLLPDETSDPLLHQLQQCVPSMG